MIDWQKRGAASAQPKQIDWVKRGAATAKVDTMPAHVKQAFGRWGRGNGPIRQMIRNRRGMSSGSMPSATASAAPKPAAPAAKPAAPKPSASAANNTTPSSYGSAGEAAAMQAYERGPSAPKPENRTPESEGSRGEALAMNDYANSQSALNRTPESAGSRGEAKAMNAYANRQSAMNRTPQSAGSRGEAAAMKAYAQSQATPKANTTPSSYGSAGEAAAMQAADRGPATGWEAVPQDFRDRFNANMQKRQALGKGRIWSNEEGLANYNERFAGNNDAQAKQRASWGPNGAAQVAGAQGVKGWSPPNAHEFAGLNRTPESLGSVGEANAMNAMNTTPESAGSRGEAAAMKAQQPQDALWRNPEFFTGNQLDFGKMKSFLGKHFGADGMQQPAQPAQQGPAPFNYNAQNYQQGAGAAPQMTSTAQPAIAAATAPKPQQGPAPFSYNAQNYAQGTGAAPQVNSTAKPAIAAATAPKPTGIPMNSTASSALNFGKTSAARLRSALLG